VNDEVGVLRRPVVTVVLIALISGGCGDDSTSSTDAQVTETAHIQIARNSMAAWNTGEVDAYLDFFADDAVLLEWPAHAAHVREGLEFYMALGDQTVLDECEEWQDGRIRCHGIGRDDLSGPVGAITEADLDMWITDGLISKYTASNYDESAKRFITDMAWWLERAHPEVWESTFAIPERCSFHAEYYNCWGSFYGTPEAAAVLLENASEFITQSDAYSITG
jgi:hypothetical protein